jgi:hypothetical protein
MSTRAVIAIVDRRGKIKATSVGYDGYPDYMMPILKKLKTRKAIENIIDAGGKDGLSSIVYDPKTRKVEGVPWDSGYPMSSKTTFNDFNELWAEFGSHFDYYYIFGHNGSKKWEWSDGFNLFVMLGQLSKT